MSPMEVAELLSKMAAAYSRNTPAGAVEVWTEALKNVKEKDALEAFNTHVAQDSRIPRPADILRLVASRSGSRPVQQASPSERLKRLNLAAGNRAAERVQAGDEDELRFQRWKALRFYREQGYLTGAQKGYFSRVLSAKSPGGDWMKDCGIPQQEAADE